MLLIRVLLAFGTENVRCTVKNFTQMGYYDDAFIRKNDSEKFIHWPGMRILKCELVYLLMRMSLNRIQSFQVYSPTIKIVV